jgi:glucokinase
MIGAIDIGGTKIAAGMVDHRGRVLARLEQPTAPERGFEDALARMTQMLREVTGDRIGGIGIGCTGPVDPIRGAIENASLLPGWQGAELVSRLADQFGVAVALENDADAAALAEGAWGAGQGKRRFLYVTVGTGIGAGIVLDGRLYRGVDGSHPELGHQVIDASGPPCYCGARGCWESLAGGPAMVAWMNAASPGEWTAERICRLAEDGDDLALRAVEREGHYLGLGLANLVTIFCPDMIALGGGVMKSSHLFLERAAAVVRGICTQVPAAKTLLAPAGLGADTALAGAARAWHHRYHGE